MRTLVGSMALLQFALCGSAQALDVTVTCAQGAAGLVAAFDATQASMDPAHTIRLDAGCTYVLATVNNGGGDGSPNGLPVVGNRLTLEGNGATIARDAAGPAFRFLWLADAANVDIVATRFVNGLALGDDGVDAQPPGGVSVPGGSWNGFGGAIYSAGAELRIVDSSFSGNTARGGMGGDGYNGSHGGGGGGGLGGALFISSATGPGTGPTSDAVVIERSTFDANVAEGGGGGGTTSGSPNTSGGGGGGRGGPGGWRVIGGINFAASGGLFGGGAGTHANGGNIFGPPGGFAGGGGGGFDAGPGGAYGGAGGSNSFAGGGGGGLGGAIFVDGAPVEITNSTLSGNAARGARGGTCAQGGSGAGGGLFVRGGSAQLLHVTIAANAADGGSGGLPLPCAGAAGGNGSGGNIERFGGSLTMEATILADGSVTAGLGFFGSAPNGTAGDPDVRGAFASNGYNLVETRGTASGFVMTDLPQADPLLGVLQDNGGATATQQPAPASTAVNAIPAGSCSVAIDQRGALRPQVGACEVGAVELFGDLVLIDGFEDP